MSDATEPRDNAVTEAIRTGMRPSEVLWNRIVDKSIAADARAKGHSRWSPIRWWLRHEAATHRRSARRLQPYVTWTHVNPKPPGGRST